MRKIGWVLFALIALTAAPVKAAPDASQFTMRFTVTNAYTTSSGCYMTLRNGNASYDVANQGFKRCHVFYPGQTLPGRFRKAGKMNIQLLAADEKGKLTIYWCVIMSTTYLSSN